MRVIARGIVHDQSPALIANVRRCADGDLLVAFNSAGDLSAGEKAGLVRSTDGGSTWGQPETWFESVFTKGGIEAGCSLTRLSGGRLLLPYADGFYLHPRTGNYDRSALLFCPISDDGGRTWRNRKAQCFEGLEAFAFGTVVELPDGTLLLPLWGSYEKRGLWVPAVLKSRDGGESWGDWRPIADHGDETPIVLLPNGRVLALLRDYTTESNHPFHVSYSEDRGDTWTSPRKVSLDGTSPSLHIAPSGKLLAGYRSTLEGGVCHVTSSVDGGLSWKLELALELPRGSWNMAGYPTFENLDDGKLIAVFHNMGTIPGSGSRAAPDSGCRTAWYVAYNILTED